jgi:hypothetical protein
MSGCPDRTKDIAVRLQYIHDNWMPTNDSSIWLEARQEIDRLRGKLSQDPFVNAEAEEREKSAFEQGIKEGMKLAAARARKAGAGMWDHIAAVIDGKADGNSS